MPHGLKALIASIALHTVPVLAVVVGFNPSLLENKENRRIELYSVRMEKGKPLPTKTQHGLKQTRQKQDQRAGDGEYNLSGRERVAKATYEMALASQIERQRYYPKMARVRGQEGQTIIRLMIDSSGRVVQVKLETSSGVEILDEAAVDIVRRAQPFPPPPDEYRRVLMARGDNAMIFRAPISFDLKR